MDHFAHDATLRERFSKVVDKFWLWEVLASLFSLCCLLGVAIVLLSEDGRELDQWRLSIPPTAVVSFLAAVAKSSFILVISQILSQLKWLQYHREEARLLKHFKTYDSASRGPLGATQLILTSRRWLASLAALVTILALFVDPFVQLVFSFPSQSVADPSSAAMFDMVEFIRDADNLPRGVLRFGGEEKNVILRDDLRASFDLAFNNPTVLTPTLNCPSGNCTWAQPIRTLGVCATCSQITDQLRVVCPQNITLGSTNVSGGIARIICDYQFPSGSTLRAAGSTLQGVATLWNSTTVNTTTSDNGLSLATFVDFDGIQSTQNEKGATDKPLLNPAIGWSCQLSLCEKTYHTISVLNGIINAENMTEQNLFWQPDAKNTQSIEPDIILYSKGESGDILTTNYSIDPEIFRDLKQYMTIMFNSSYGGGDSKEFGRRDLEEALANTKIVVPGPSLSNTEEPVFFQGSLSMPPVPYVLALSPDVNATMQRVAASMTNAMRIGQLSDQVSGTMFHQKTFVKVQWIWLTLPVTLVLITTFLLVIVATMTQNADMPAWKDDPLALLVHRVGSHKFLCASGRTDSDHLEDWASHFYTSLDSTTPFTFVQTDVNRVEKYGKQQDRLSSSRQIRSTAVNRI